MSMTRDYLVAYFNEETGQFHYLRDRKGKPVRYYSACQAKESTKNLPYLDVRVVYPGEELPVLVTPNLLDPTD